MEWKRRKRAEGGEEREKKQEVREEENSDVERSPRKESSIQGLCQHVPSVKKANKQKNRKLKTVATFEGNSIRGRRTFWPGGDLHCSGELSTGWVWGSTHLSSIRTPSPLRTRKALRYD